VCVCVYAESISVGVRACASARVRVCVRARVRASVCACAYRALDLSKNILKALPEWLCEALPNLMRLLLSKNRYQE
jgi:hypothetical protein